jgi:PAS domain S-box-containing protein
MKVLLKKLEVWLRQLPPPIITAIALGWVLVLGVADSHLSTPPGLTVFYFFAVALAAWGAGKWHAWFIATGAAITMLAAYWWSHRALPHAGWLALWINCTRYLVLCFVGWLLAELARLTRSLEQQVQERTAQWKAEADQHKATAARLSEAVERFEQVINNITQVFWLKDLSKGQTVYISPGFERIWGRTCEELYRQPASWLAAVHPADRDAVSRRARTEQASGGYDLEYRIVQPDGAVRWIRDRAFPVHNASGEVYRIAGLAEDVTEPRKSRETLQMQAAILENMAEGVVVTDEQGVIVQMNPAAERIWGYASKEMLGQPASVLSALPEPEANALQREVLAALRATGTWRGVFKDRRKDGTLIHCEAVVRQVEIRGQMLMVAVQQDVTERLRAQDQLQLQARVLESMAEAVLMIDDSGTIVLTNPAMDTLLGYERGELQGRPMAALSGRTIEEFRRNYAENLEQVKTRGSAAFEAIARRKDGTRIEVETRTSGVTIGDRLFQVIVGQDVTQRKQAERALRQSEESLRVFLDAVPEVATLLERDGTIIFGNEALANRVGLPKEQLKGKRAFDFFGEKLGHSRKAMFDQAVRTRQQVRFEDERAGRHFISIASPVLDTAGNVSRVAVFALDITERKQAERVLIQREELYRTLFDLCPDGILLEDDQGNILDLNEAICDATGYRREELLGHNVRRLVPTEHLEEVDAHLTALRAGKPLQHEVWNLRKSGELCLLWLNEQRLVLPDGRPAILVVARDITEAKRAELTKEAFVSLGTSLSAARSPVEVARAIYATADLFWKWDAGALDLRLPNSAQYETVLAWDVLAGQRREVATLLPPGTPTPRMRRILAQGGELILRQPGEGAGADVVPFGDASRLCASIIAVPVRIMNEPGGVLSVQSYARNAFTQSDLQTLQTLADYCGDALERLRAEAVLRESEQTYRALVETTGTGYLILDGQGRVLDANAEYVRLSGHQTLEEIRGRSVVEWTALQDRERNAATVEECRRTGAVRNLEVTYAGPNRLHTPVEINGTVVQTKQGPTILSLCWDTTERKRGDAAREALLALGSRLNAAQTSIEAARAIYATADQLWKWDASILLLYSPELDWMQPVLFCDVVDGQRREIAPRDLDGYSPMPRIRRILEGGAELILENAPTPQPDFVAFGDVSRLSATLMYVPLRWEGRAVGVLSIQSYTPNAYTREDLRTLQALADYCGGALERIRASQALRDAHGELERRVYKRTAELRAANSALLQSEAQLRLALDASNAGTWSWDATTNFSTWDSRYCELYGFEPGSPMSLEVWLGRVIPADRERLRARIQALVEPAGGDVWDEEFRVLHPVKGERWMGELGRVERDEAGRAVRLAGINLDVTERKRAEEAQRAQLAYIETIYQNAPVGLCALDLDLRYVRVNERLAAMNGLSVEQHIGRTVRETVPHVAEETEATCRQVMATGLPVLNLELEGTTAAQPGVRRTWVSSLVPLKAQDGRVTGVSVFVEEVTERKRMDQALREARDQLEQRVQERTAELVAANAALTESEERYRSLVNNLNVGVYRSQPRRHGVFIQVNPAFARIHGYESAEGFQKVQVADLYQNPRDRETFLADLLREGAVVNYGLRLKKKDGTSIYGSVSATVHQAANGEVDWIDGVLEDITERKQAEHSLAEALEFNRQVVSASTVGIAAYRASGQCVMANHALARITGGTAEQLLQQDFRRLKSWRTDGLLAKAEAALATRQPQEIECPSRTTFGRELAISARFSSFVTKGELHLLLMLTDETTARQAQEALRASEERYRTLAESSPDAIFILDHDIKVEYVNSAAAALWKRPASELIGLTQQELFPPPIAQHHNQEVRGVLATGQPVRQDESITFPTGDQWIEIRLAPLSGPQGTVTSVMGVCRDITERKQTEMLLQAQRDLGVCLGPTTDLPTALKHLLDIVLRLGGVDSGGVHLLNEVTGGMDLLAHHGASPAFIKALSHWPPGSPQLQLVEQGRPIFALHRDLPIPQDEPRRREGLRAVGLVPLCHEGKAIGALGLSSHVADEIPRQTRLVVEALAAQAATAMARIQAEAQRHRLERQLLEISDREQARIGHEIHDGLCQHLVSLAFDANTLRRTLTAARRTEAGTARRIARYLDNAITEARQLSRGLFPVRLDKHGLPPALEELAKATCSRFNIRCRFVGDDLWPGVDSILATHLYRIAQEAVTNAVKHSRGRSVSIRLRARASKLELTVADNGAGLSADGPRKSGGLGLHIMDYRARTIGGTLRLGPGRRGGTVVYCCVPNPPG